MTGRYEAIDLNHDVARWTRETAAGSLVLAEHGHDFRPDLDGTGWHGAMNYAGFLKPTWWWLRDDSIETDVFSSAPAPRYDGAELVERDAPLPHGRPVAGSRRTRGRCSTRTTPLASRQSSTARATLHRVGVGLMMTTPGVPMIFAGDEIGLEGAWGEDARRTMPWQDRDAWDGELLESYRALAALRRSSDALARGGIRYVHVDDRRRRLPARDARRAPALPRGARLSRRDLDTVHESRDALRRRRDTAASSRQTAPRSTSGGSLTWLTLPSKMSTRSTTTASRPSSS